MEGARGWGSSSAGFLFLKDKQRLQVSVSCPRRSTCDCWRRPQVGRGRCSPDPFLRPRRGKKRWLKGGGEKLCISRHSFKKLKIKR